MAGNEIYADVPGKMPYVTTFSRRSIFGRKQWFFDIRAGNNRVLVESQGYQSERDRDEGLAAMLLLPANSRIVRRD